MISGLETGVDDRTTGERSDRATWILVDGRGWGWGVDRGSKSK